MLIQRVTIENFKRFGRLEQDLHSFDCITGPNNSGKTTLLQALALFDFCVHHCVGARNGENGRAKLRRRTITPEEFYVLPVSTPIDLWTDRRVQQAGAHIVIKIRVQFDAGPEVGASIDLSYNRFSVSIDTEDQTEQWLQQLRSARISYLPVFSSFLPQEERRTPAVIEDELARGRVSAVVRNLLLNLNYDGRDGELTDVLRRVFPTLTDLRIAFDEANERYISVTYEEKGRPKAFDVFSGGSGFQQFVYLFGFILLRQPTVILLDEPDVHLHGSLQQALLSELRRLVGAGKQVIFATHSRDLITRMNPEDIVYLEEPRPLRLSVRFDVYDALSRLGSLGQDQLAAFQAYRRVVVVEDRTDWDILSVFCRKCLGTSQWQQIERRLAVCYAKGNPWQQDMPRLRSQLEQVLPMPGRSVRMFVIGDRDYYPDLDELRGSLPDDSGRIQWHVWERAEIENYLISAEGIDRLLGSPQDLASAMFRDELGAELGRLIESSKDSANDHLVAGFRVLGRRTDQRWDPARLSRQAREYLRSNWESDRLSLLDAKDVVLPGIKRWLQEKRLGQFSDRALAEALEPSDLPPEMHEVAKSLREFAGVGPGDASQGGAE